MMRKTSTQIWFRLIRVRLAAAVVAVFLLFLLITLADPPLDPEYVGIIPVVGFLAAFLLGLHSLLSTSMFPVTNREVAWIPMKVWGVVCLAGAGGVLCGQLWAYQMGRVYYYDIPPYWYPALKTWPAVVFPCLILWRGLRLNPGFMGFLGFLPMLMLNKATGAKGNGLLSPELTQAYLGWWPLWLAGCVFLVWEAPSQTAMLRRVAYQSNGAIVKMSVPQLTGPGQPGVATRVADGLMAFIVMVLIVMLGVQFCLMPWHQLRSTPVAWWLLFLFSIPLAFAASGWRAARASGLSPAKSMLVVALTLTGIGLVVRPELGVARGMAVNCGFCGGWRMAWQSACPHCGDSSPEQVDPATRTQTGFAALFFPRHDPLAISYRVFGPVYALILIVVFNLQK